ncbi:MAG: hypothetical protein O7F11_05495 [Acidobacteria bacterium]|nr:hypothetical protein [Acidobacteriota bacterium]
MASPRIPGASLLLTGCVLLFMAPALWPGKTLMTQDPGRWEPWRSTVTADSSLPSYNADHARFVLPRAVLLRQALAAGELPLWDPTSFMGNPFLALWQTQVLYPPNLLLLLVDGRASLAWAVVLHLLIAGLGMLYLGKGIGLSRPASLLGALVFTFGGHMALRMGHPSFIATLAWLPWCVLAVERFLQLRRVRWLAGLALFWALLILAGQATLVVYSGYLLAAWILVRTLRPFRGRALLVLATALLAGTLLASPQILASLELAQRSGRAERSLDRLERSQLPARQLTQILAPELFGTVRNGTSDESALLPADDRSRLSFAASVAGYGGSWIPVLALLGLAGGAWSRRRTLLAAAAMAALLLATGSPLFDLAHGLLPGFRFSVGNRALPILLFVMAVLAARGAHLLACGEVTRRRKIMVGWTWMALMIAGWAWLRFLWLPGRALAGLHGDLLATAAAALDRALALGGLCGGGLILVSALLPPAGRPRTGTWRTKAYAWWCLALLLLAGELLLFAAPYRVVRPRGQVFPPAAAGKWLEEHAPGSRVVLYEKNLAGPPQEGLMRANLPALLGLRQVGGFGPLHPRDLNRFLSAVGWTRMTAWGVRAVTDAQTFASPLFPLLGVRYVLSLPGAELPGLSRVFSGSVEIWEYPAPQPPAFLVTEIVAATDPDEALKLLRAGDFDVRTTATVEGEHSLPGAGAAGALPGEARVVERGFNRIVLDVKSQGPAWLVLSESWAPGWTVAIDGGPRAASVRTDAVLQGARVPAGEHQVVFSYRPAFVWQGTGAALLGLALLCGMVLPNPLRRWSLKFQPDGIPPHDQAGGRI